MSLQTIVDALNPLVENAEPTGDGMRMVINLSTDQYRQIEDVVAMMQLANLMNYKRAQDAYPRLLQALKLVVAIADHPDANPGEQISLATKTRAQLDSALMFAEKP